MFKMVYDSLQSQGMKQSFNNHAPKHIAIIMDGNGRWAEQRKKPRLWGHKQGVESVRSVVKTAGEMGIQYLTLYAFSEENWGRPKTEVSGIMGLLNTFVVKERQELMEKNVRLKTIGRIDLLPSKTKRLVEETREYLSANDGLTLTIALSYGARTEISEACKAIAKDVKDNKLDPESVNTDLLGEYLWTCDLPDPDLLIRTSGEQRISNFLLWQIAYSELWFSPLMWPDFRGDDLISAIDSYKLRKRRYGLIDPAKKSEPRDQHSFKLTNDREDRDFLC